jgi:hypothetical protein
MSESVNVYLDRDGLAAALLTLLLPEQGALEELVEATATEINGVPTDPATFQRVHREVEQQLAAAQEGGTDEEEAAMDELKELFGDDWTVESSDSGKLTAEKADAAADRAVAHSIIAALAEAYPLRPEQRSALAVEE